MCRKTLLGCLAVAFVFSLAREAAAQQPKGGLRGTVEDTATYLVKAHDSIALSQSRMQDLQTQIERVRADPRTAPTP